SKGNRAAAIGSSSVFNTKWNCFHQIYDSDSFPAECRWETTNFRMVWTDTRRSIASQYSIRNFPPGRSRKNCNRPGLRMDVQMLRVPAYWSAKATRSSQQTGTGGGWRMV